MPYSTDARESENRNVFINCPFDPEYEGILQAIIFVLVDLDFKPRLASEDGDSGASRLAKITKLIQESRYSIHDLSRAKAEKKGAFARMNMPFELGIALGCKEFSADSNQQRHIMVMAEHQYDYQNYLSDIAGWDIYAHKDDYNEAIKSVRKWLSTHHDNLRPYNKVKTDYISFQEWDYEYHLDQGWNDESIMGRKPREVIQSMQLWLSKDRPASFN